MVVICYHKGRLIVIRIRQRRQYDLKRDSVKRFLHIAISELKVDLRGIKVCMA
jgi:hypothetical protein